MPLLKCKARLQRLLAKARDGLEFTEHLEGDGTDIFGVACKLGMEASSRSGETCLTSPAGPKRWLKIKNPDPPAAKRILDETFDYSKMAANCPNIN